MQVELLGDAGRQASAALLPGTVMAVTGALDIQMFVDKASGRRNDFPKIKAESFEVGRAHYKCWYPLTRSMQKNTFELIQTRTALHHQICCIDHE